MPWFFKAKSFRIALFWQFYAKYFMLILVPAILATTFTNLFVVQLIEKEAEKSSSIVMGNYAQQADAEFHALQSSMIRLLGTPNLKGILEDMDSPVYFPAYSMEKIERIYAMMAQLNAIRTESFVSGAFLYFVHSDLVIDNIYADKAYYFNNQYVLEPGDSERLLSQFSGKKMMHFTDLYTISDKDSSGNSTGRSSHLSVIMSYPFNSDEPEVYLAVQIQKEMVQRLIRTRESWISRTAVVDTDHGVIGQSDNGSLDTGPLIQAIRSGDEGALAPYGRMEAVSFVRSGFDPSWYYVTWIDLQTLLQPARMLRTLSVAFLAFFLLLGAFLSYYLSRRLYNPISEIRKRLQSHPVHLSPENAVNATKDNDFDTIRRFSMLLINENKELSQLVKGILPVVQEDFITRILLGEYRDDLSIEYYSKEIAFSFKPHGPRAVLVIEYRYFGPALEQLSETSKSFLLTELKEKLLKRLAGPVWLCQTRADLLACVVPQDQQEQEAGHRLREVAESIKAVLEQYASYFKATIGIGRTVPALGDLHLSYQHGLSRLRQKSLNDEVEIYGDDEAWDDREPFDSFLSAEEINRIANMYKSGEYGRLLRSALDLLEAGKRRKASAFQMKNLCADVLNAWIRAVETERNDFSISFYSELFESMNRCQTWQELGQCLERIHGMLFRPPSSANRKEQFAGVVQYIHDHYHEELSIEQFAGSLNMSVSHFSRTFKEEIGEKYVEYITKYRLATAKRLLIETDMKIEEIAERVGYLGSNAFIRIFRKYEGITPGKYRSIQ